MKKTLSIILSSVIMLSMVSVINISAYASTRYESEHNDAFKWANDIRLYDEITGSNYDLNDYDYFRFQLTSTQNISLTFSHEIDNCGAWNIVVRVPYYDVYLDKIIYADDSKTNNFNLGSFSAGEYYIIISPYDYYGYPNETEYSITLYETILRPSNFKVSTRNTTNLKLSWSKVSDVSGYQLQRKSGDTYKTVATTTYTSATVENLSSATNYKFRVRAYKTIEGKKYYSDWKYLTTPTKPGKVSIKSPSTNSKHQIIAKWNKVTRASGYQVQYCKNSSCSNVIATKNVSGGSKTSYTGKNFTKGKKYYVRVRAYKTVDGTKYYGAWSSVKSIKCK